METTCWGGTLTDGIVSYMNRNAATGARVVFHPVGENVINILKLTERLREDINELPAPGIDEADFLVLIYRQGMLTEEIKNTVERRRPVF